LAVRERIPGGCVDVRWLYAGNYPPTGEDPAASVDLSGRLSLNLSIGLCERVFSTGGACATRLDSGVE